MTEPGKRAKGIAARLFLLSGALVAAILIAELGVRVLGLAPDINRINPRMKRTVFRISENPTLGYVFKENYRDHGNPDLKSSYPSINSHGFRDIERQYAKPPGVRRIILLGDSIVAGAVNIPDIDDTISRKLEQSLEHQEIEVLNMGINGYCTRAEVELLAQRGLRYEPDLVFLIFVQNDFNDINADLGFVTQPLLVQTLFVRSHLFRSLAVKYNLFRLRTQFGVQEIAGEWVGDLIAKNFDRASDIVQSDRPTSRVVKEHLYGIGENNVHTALPMLVQMSRDHGFRLAIGIWPHFAPEGATDLEAFNTVDVYPVPPPEKLEIEKLAKKNGILHFRFSPYFQSEFLKQKASGATDDARAYFVGDGSIHPNATGTALAAEAIRSILEAHPELLGEAVSRSTHEGGPK